MCWVVFIQSGLSVADSGFLRDTGKKNEKGTSCIWWGTGALLDIKLYWGTGPSLELLITFLRRTRRLAAYKECATQCNPPPESTTGCLQ